MKPACNALRSNAGREILDLDPDLIGIEYLKLRNLEF